MSNVEKLSPDKKLSRDEIRRRIGLAPADNQHSEPLHTWESPDWSILDDRRGTYPSSPPTVWARHS
jgi:hypothetical protein